MSTILAPTGGAVGVRERMRAFAEERFEASIEVPTRFFEGNADRISRACFEMARRFRPGGRLLVFGEGAAVSDAHHVAVEFVHPVLVGKRALPALAIADVGTLAVIGREGDIAMGIAGRPASSAIPAALACAKAMGMLTIGLADELTHSSLTADFLFTVPSSDRMLVQEVHETTYHVLWELVHVFLEQAPSNE